MRQGVNEFNNTGYREPCPASGTHRFSFKVYALDQLLDIPESRVTKDFLLRQMRGHILADAQLVGIYQKNAEEKTKEKMDQKVEEASEESFPASDPPATY